jgi:CRP-like cAMP-binding protein
VSSKEIAQQLRCFSALSSLGDEHLTGLSQSVRLVKFRSGSWLCREGDIGTCCYFLLQGTVSVSKQLADGRKVYLSTLIAGHLFGQTGLIPKQVRTADVTATSAVEVLILERDQLESAISRGMNWGTSLQRLIASHLVRQLRTALARLEALAGRDDAEAEAEGRKHSEVAKPQSLGIDFTAPRVPRVRYEMAQPEEGEASTAESDEWEELPPVPTTPTPRDELFELLQATEAGLGGSTDFQLQTVRVVLDEDQMRTAAARGT